MSAEKNWNKDEMLDIGSVGEDYLDPFGDDELEQESRQYEEKKAAEAKPPKQEKTAQKPATKQEKAAPNPLEAEIAAAEEKDAETARDGLFSKPPVFSYVSASGNRDSGVLSSSRTGLVASRAMIVMMTAISRQA